MRIIRHTHMQNINSPKKYQISASIAASSCSLVICSQEKECVNPITNLYTIVTKTLPFTNLSRFELLQKPRLFCQLIKLHFTKFLHKIIIMPLNFTKKW